MLAFIDPQEIEVADKKGNKKTFVISEIPAVPSRKIAATYFSSAMPKIGDYPTNEALAEEMMKYVAVKTESGEQRLTTKELINNHCDFLTYATLEKEMIKLNFGFFLQETISGLFETIIQKALALSSEISTGSLGQFLQRMAKQPSTTSEQYTP